MKYFTYLVLLAIGFWIGFTTFTLKDPKPRQVLQELGSIVLCKAQNGLPDPSCNQPVQNPTLTVKDVCDPSFRTGSIRPPTSYTTPLKIQKMKEYGIPGDPQALELDHLQPLTDLGDPKSSTNLWPEFWHLDLDGFDAGAKTKDSLEVKVHKLLCTGKMNTTDVSNCFSDWITCYRKVIGELPAFERVE